MGEPPMPPSDEASRDCAFENWRLESGRPIYRYPDVRAAPLTRVSRASRSAFNTQRIGDADMNNPLASDCSRSFGLLAARVSLGLMLAIAGIEKLARGTSNFVDYTSTRAPSFMPAWYARHVPAALPYAAVVVGCLLAFGFLTR